MQKSLERSQFLYKLLPVELLAHLVIGAATTAYFWAQEKPGYLFSFMVTLVAVSLLRYIALWIIRSQDNGEQEESCDSLSSYLFIGNVLAGLVWAALPVVIYYADTRNTSNHLFAMLPTTVALLISFSGSAFRPRLFMAYALPATLLPLLFYLRHALLEPVLITLLLLIVVVLMAKAARNFEEVMERYRQSLRGNAMILEVLASARDEAVKSQREAERASETIKGEIIERQRVEEKIRASEQELSRILQDMQDTFFRIDEEGIVVNLSPSIEYLLGFTPVDLLGRPGGDLFVSSDEYLLFQEELKRSLGVVQNFEVRLRHRLGQRVWVSINAHYYVKEGKSKTNRIEGTMHDITERKQAAEALFQEKERLHVTLESIGDGVITTNVEGVVQYINPVAEAMTGWSDGEGKGKPLATVMQLIDEDSNLPIALSTTEWLTEGRRVALTSTAVLVEQGEASRAAIELTGSPIRDSKQGIIGSVLVFRDVTKLRNLTKQLSYQATHDALTGLINRVEFDKRVGEAINSALRGDIHHALCYLDLDQFKVVNDTCGHHAGDELLRQLTALLLKTLRETDTLARLGGDEFGVLLSGCRLEKAAEIAENQRRLVEEFRFIWEDKAFRVGLSIGVVPISCDTTGLTELLSAADSACYVAKERGRNCVHVFEPDDKAIAEHHGQMQWMQRIQRALDHDLFELYIQAIVPVKEPARGGRHGELLLRMIDDLSPSGHEMVPPNAFIPAAERYHLMPQIDRWVVRNALYALEERNGTRRQLSMCAINLSGQSLGDLKLLEYIVELFKETRVPPSIMCFEITESAVIANLDVAKEFISRLKMMGCRFALDDFGSGLSSFGYLKNLPVDYVKLDGSLVRDIAASRVSQAMVQAINYVTHVMGMKSIAEYVETEAIFKVLKAISVDYAQGYGIERPRFFTKAATRQQDKISNG